MPADDIFGQNPQKPLKPEKVSIIRKLRTTLSDWLAVHPESSLPQEKERTSEIGTADANYSTFGDARLRILNDRKSVYLDMKEMDANDCLISTGLDIIADASTGHEDPSIDCFTWELKPANAPAMEVLEELRQRLDLGAECWQIVRSFVRNGEEYREVVVDDKMLIRRFKQLIPYTVIPNFDEFGNKQPGWFQRTDISVLGKQIEFAEWQIVPFVYGARRGYFGTPLMYPARRTWRRLQKMADGMAIARMTRAYDKMLHRVPVDARWDQERVRRAILAYKNEITRRKGLDGDGNMTSDPWPMEVETAFFVPDDGSKRGGVDVLAAQNMQLMNISDLEFHRDELLSRLKVPRRYLGLPSQSGALTDGGLAAEDIQFARTLRQVQAVLRPGLKRLAHLALIFQGYNLAENDLIIRLPRISTQDQLQNAKILYTYAQAAQIYQQIFGGLPLEIVWTKFLELDDELKAILKNFVTEQEKKAEAMQKALARGPVPEDETGDAPTGKEVAQALATLQMLVQSELKARGVSWGAGYEEAYTDAEDALVLARVA